MDAGDVEDGAIGGYTLYRLGWCLSGVEEGNFPIGGRLGHGIEAGLELEKSVWAEKECYFVALAFSWGRAPGCCSED